MHLHCSHTEETLSINWCLPYCEYFHTLFYMLFQTASKIFGSVKIISQIVYFMVNQDYSVNFHILFHINTETIFRLCLRNSTYFYYINNKIPWFSLSNWVTQTVINTSANIKKNEFKSVYLSDNSILKNILIWRMWNYR